MTFKDQKLVQSQQPDQTELFQRPRDKPFWIWDQIGHKQIDIATKGDCCFNHTIGVPTKDGLDKPMFDYEKLLYDSLFQPGGNIRDKHV